MTHVTYTRLVRMLGPSVDIQRKLKVTKQRVYYWRKHNKVPLGIMYRATLHVQREGRRA